MSIWGFDYESTAPNQVVRHTDDRHEILSLLCGVIPPNMLVPQGGFLANDKGFLNKRPMGFDAKEPPNSALISGSLAFHGARNCECIEVEYPLVIWQKHVDNVCMG